ncbi:hypothetical protein ACUXV3_18425 [Roseobacteraceae bacterium NS-SX3]
MAGRLERPAKRPESIKAFFISRPDRLIALFLYRQHSGVESMIPQNAPAPLSLMQLKIIFHRADKEAGERQTVAFLI